MHCSGCVLPQPPKRGAENAMLVPATLDDEGAAPTQRVAGADGCAGAGQVLDLGGLFAEEVRAAHAHGHLRVVAEVHEVSGILDVAAAPALRWRAGVIADGGPDGHGSPSLVRSG